MSKPKPMERPITPTKPPRRPRRQNLTDQAEFLAVIAVGVTRSGRLRLTGDPAGRKLLAGYADSILLAITTWLEVPQ